MRFFIRVFFLVILHGGVFALPAGSEKSFSGLGVDGQAIGFTGISADSFSCWANPALYDITRLQTGGSIEGMAENLVYRFFGGVPTPLGQIGARLSYDKTLHNLLQFELLWSRTISRWFSLGIKLNTGMMLGQGFFSLDIGAVQRGGEGSGIGFYNWDYALVLKNIGSSVSLFQDIPWKPFMVSVGGGFSPLRFGWYNLRLQSDVSLSFSPFFTLVGMGMKHTFWDAFSLSAGYQLPLGTVVPFSPTTSAGIGLVGGVALDKEKTNLIMRFGKTPSASYTEVALWYSIQMNPALSHNLMVNVSWGQYDDKPPVISSLPVVFFSPNLDGIKDEAIFPLPIVDNDKLSGWEVEIVDSTGKVVRRFESWQSLETKTLSLKNIVKRIITPDRGIEIPPSIKWDGRNDKGEKLPDGTYRYRIRARDITGNETASSWQSVVLDTEKRDFHLETSSTVFSPNGDGNLETIEISFKNVQSLPQDRLVFVVEDASGKEVSRTVWTNEDGLPPMIVWKGEANGNLLPEGVYRLVLRLESDAGNTMETNTSVQLVRTMETASLVLSKNAFSARKEEVVTITPQVSSTNLLKKWLLTIQNEKDQVVREIGGSSPLPSLLPWDGRDNQGTIVSDGIYTATLQLFYESGNQPKSSALPITIDNTSPVVNVKLPYTIFSPLPDSKQRTLPISLDIKAASNDILTLTIVDETGSPVFYEQKPAEEWEKSIEWTGLNPKLEPLPEGRYALVVEAEDAVGNRFQTNISPIVLRTGRERLSVSTASAFVSPRLTPTARFTLEGNPQGIKNLEFVIRDESNRERYRLFTNIWLSIIDVPLNNLPDNYYTYQAKALYEDGQNPQSPERRLEIDSIPPKLGASVDIPAFSPNNDGRRDSLVVRFSPEGRSNDVFSMAIYNEKGEIVRSTEWRGPVQREFLWNGKDNTGKELSEGTYHLSFTSRDNASNVTREWISNVYLAKTYPELSFEVNDIAIVPGKRPLVVRGTVTETNRIERNEFQILNQKGETVYQQALNRWSNLWTWDGKTTQGIAPDGYYTIRWGLSYLDGNALQAELEDIIVDSQPPKVELFFSPVVFTPDGDGENDTLSLRATLWDLAGLEHASLSILKIRENLPPLPVKRWEWQFEDEPSLFEKTWDWNGLGDDGELVESVQDYMIEIVTRDILGHTNRYQTNFTTGVLIEKLPEGLRIRISSVRFALNSARLTSQSQEILGKMVSVFQRLLSQPERYGLTSDFFIEVSGHTDDLPGPTPDFNTKLSEKRAKAVYDYLVSQGIPADKLTWAGYGEKRPYKPIKPEMSKEQRDELRSRNRRVEFFIRKRK
ncbi:T9SS type B sorting domain-containing protein [Thermospira aquatica]|uniref:Gliding motility-associated C-terminal domain-containing protein n=1 Tax=Thermospira aquatica TaxID=2828656 RepID=A0AAX3BDX4_9SPIR|nr:gliding motility-associated C-terminal domain-containing protein [Thermospira aquatica]URA10472.1 gliding motility-associated C-terminal domain-containing protein [Thermospira aquatica]